MNPGRSYSLCSSEDASDELSRRSDGGFIPKFTLLKFFVLFCGGTFTGAPPDREEAKLVESSVCKEDHIYTKKS